LGGGIEEEILLGLIGERILTPLVLLNIVLFK